MIPLKTWAFLEKLSMTTICSSEKPKFWASTSKNTANKKWDSSENSSETDGNQGLTYKTLSPFKISIKSYLCWTKNAKLLIVRASQRMLTAFLISTTQKILWIPVKITRIRSILKSNDTLEGHQSQRKKHQNPIIYIQHHILIYQIIILYFFWFKQPKFLLLL